MIHRGKYHLATVNPPIDVKGNVAFSAGDILFDWHPFEIPKGGFCIKTFTAIVGGTERVAQAGVDMELFFGTTVNGFAPPSLGVSNAATTLLATTACRPHIIGRQYIDASAVEDGDRLIGYNVWSDSGGAALGLGTAKLNDHELILEGDPNYVGDPDRVFHTPTTPGYQTVWIAAFTIGTPDKGTGVLLNVEGGIAASGGGIKRGGSVSTVTVLTTDGEDADDVFAIGDEIMSFNASGVSPSLIGIVISVTANTITVSRVREAIADDDEIVFRSPYQLKLGIEY